ncbi:hypothetical protein SLE2022_022200 [Rubroshorea leprosula]
MEKSETDVEIEGGLSFLPPHDLTVVAAINGNSKSKYVVGWALDKFIPEGNLVLKLLYVRPRIKGVPTPMGNYIPFSQVREDVAAAFMKEVDCQTSELLLPYKKMCAQRKVQADVLLIESDDVANAIAEVVAKGGITKLVIGAPNRSLFTRKAKKNNSSSRISVCTPSSCTVYVVSKGKLLSIRPSDEETIGSFKDDRSEISFSRTSSRSSSVYTSRKQSDSCSVASYASYKPSSLLWQRFQALSAISKRDFHARNSSSNISHSRCQSLDITAGKAETGVAVSQSPSGKSLEADRQSWTSDQASILDVVTDCSFSESQVKINSEAERLRIQLSHVKGLYAMAQSETFDASQKLDTLDKRRIEEETKLQEISSKEEEAKELARQEKEKYEAARKEAEYVKHCADREASQRREAEMKIIHEAKEKDRLESALVGPVLQYQKFTWEEIVSATSSFSDDLKIGKGAYGTVYKCFLHHTAAAVKVLHSKDSQSIKEFQRELAILCTFKHPHLLLLIGACVDKGCLVYEYMENGSLEERLLRKHNTPPIPWFERYRIAWEVASALVFLHNTKPKPIIHRDLKPANILLDHNFVSKIGDVGLSTMLNSDTGSETTTYKDAGLVGTVCYIDPEYQVTGLISPKCDVYAFGIVILQLLTAKPAMALPHMVETAMDDGKLMDILDSEAGDWPVEETEVLASLGLRCSELRRKHRPDLKDKVLPTLERLKKFASEASELQSAPPNHFICPILNDVMDDPCVAADGYNYEHKAIERWLQ